MSQNKDYDEVTRKLWKIIQPVLGLPKECTHMTLEMGIDHIPKVTYTHYIDNVFTDEEMNIENINEN